jgi:hypothetical protein
MVTRSEAIERMAIGLVPSLQVVLGGGSVPPTPTTFDRVKAAAALDALLDYLEENQARMLMFGGRVALGHALVSELVALLKEEE